jgi:DNA-binding NtrC family response regulator
MLDPSSALTQNSHGPSSMGVTANDESTQTAPVPFVCVSSALRRLVVQAEIAAPRLHLATLEGESGTGKHHFAQTIHRQSHLANLPFRRRDAREWLANESDISVLSGALYLDRVDLLATTGQGLLLGLVKALQNNIAGPRRFLLLVSAHASLRQLASRGAFLPDLAFRLSAVRFGMPPLRERREDIAPITQTLIESICRRYQQPTAILAPGSLPLLLQYAWPGNVGELASVLESAILDSTTGVIRPANLALPPAPEPRSLAPSIATRFQVHEIPRDLSLDAAIQHHIRFVLELNRNNKLRAARQLGISRSTLYRLLAGEPMVSQTE